MKTKNLFCALAFTVTAIFFAPLPVAASVSDMLEMSEKIDQADKQDLLTLIDKANDCTRARNFSCSEEQLRKAAKLANGSKDKLALNAATKNLQAEKQRVEEEARARAEQERQIKLAEERRVEEAREEEQRVAARRREEDQAEERRRLAQRQEQRRQDANDASARVPTFAQSIQSSINFNNDLTKIRNDAAQETNRRIQENRDRADAQRRAEERATADRREDERSNQRAADRRAQDAERARQAQANRPPPQVQTYSPPPVAVASAGAEGRATDSAGKKATKNSAETKTVVGEGNSDLCFAREHAVHLAQVGAKNNAHEECRALGSGWQYEGERFSGYVGCTPCTGGEKGNFKCKVTQATYYCKKP